MIKMKQLFKCDCGFESVTIIKDHKCKRNKPLDAEKMLGFEYE